jgi:pyruvate/2-oxoglutarate dehydrogenase complex dihydrolipoamide acyltransferase (E2) component
MFGTGAGWAISPTNYTLQLTIGGIGTKPRVVDGDVRPREVLSLTVTFDHDVVDGAPAARFVQRLRERLEAGHSLDSPPEG